MNDEITFKIERHLGVINTYPTGWSKEVNLVSWNGGIPKIDIRDWDPEHSAMSRGITLHEKEAAKLIDAVQKNMPDIMKHLEKNKDSRGFER